MGFSGGEFFRFLGEISGGESVRGGNFPPAVIHSDIQRKYSLCNVYDLFAFFKQHHSLLAINFGLLC